MGGTFDPIHLGHLVAGSEALHAFDLDRILFVPAGRPWQRADYSDAEDRYLMTSLAASLHPAFAVSRIELDRRGPTYTADTLEELQAFYGDAEFMFILGADAVIKLGTWVGLERLRELTEVIAVNRPGADLDDLQPEPGWPTIHILEMPQIGISASDIRQRVREERPIDFLVPTEVAGYIRERGLYIGSEEVPGA
jgi:nicotinate-nucleotide adenylyltransferase